MRSVHRNPSRTVGFDFGIKPKASFEIRNFQFPNIIVRLGKRKTCLCYTSNQEVRNYFLLLLEVQRSQSFAAENPTMSPSLPYNCFYMRKFKDCRYLPPTTTDLAPHALDETLLPQACTPTLNTHTNSLAVSAHPLISQTTSPPGPKHAACKGPPAPHPLSSVTAYSSNEEPERSGSKPLITR